MMTTQAPAVKTMIRILDDYAIVPSSKGSACYHVAIEDGLAVHCTCPDHARRSRVCKHMDAVDQALRGQVPRAAFGRGTYEVALTPKPAPRKVAAVGGAMARVEAEVSRLASEVRSTAAAAQTPEEREELREVMEGDRMEAELARAESEVDEATDADWDAYYCYW